jgi:hypothetical protein
MINKILVILICIIFLQFLGLSNNKMGNIATKKFDQDILIVNHLSLESQLNLKQINNKKEPELKNKKVLLNIDLRGFVCNTQIFDVNNEATVKRLLDLISKWKFKPFEFKGRKYGVYLFLKIFYRELEDGATITSYTTLKNITDFVGFKDYYPYLKNKHLSIVFLNLPEYQVKYIRDEICFSVKGTLDPFGKFENVKYVNGEKIIDEQMFSFLSKWAFEPKLIGGMIPVIEISFDVYINKNNILAIRIFSVNKIQDR